MYWFKNIELKRMFIALIIILILLGIINLSISLNLINKIEKDIELNNLKIVDAIVQKYPSAEEEAIKAIVNMKEYNLDEARKLLNKYGINKNSYIEDMIYLVDLKHNIIIYNFLFYIISFIVFFIIIDIYLKIIYKKISKLNNNTIDALNKSDAVNLIDNNEGDLSILNNSIYKITTSLREQKGQLKKDKLYLKEALSDISHQLKTPLTSLNIITDLLNRDLNEKDKAIFMEKMHLSLDRIEWLISSLLKLSQLDSKTIKLDKKKVNIKKLILASLKSLSIIAEFKGLNISIKGNNNLSFIGDFNWSKEAITNIIKNSIEHTSFNGEINITWSDNPIYTEITIRDNGEGIPKKDLPFIFKRFYKAKNSHRDSIGIGLAMAKTIIDNQNGDISVKSELNKYTIFSIKIYKFNQ